LRMCASSSKTVEMRKEREGQRRNGNQTNSSNRIESGRH
jgi:hypothetical protein